jgi:TRAP-type uncharacterized transport system fused permease subunit
MRNIRRFQRTIFTVLLGINVLVFSISFGNPTTSAIWHSISTMSICAAALLIGSLLRKSNAVKKSNQVLESSEEN